MKSTLDTLKKYGSFSLAYSTLQPKCSLFKKNDGYISYVPFKQTPFPSKCIDIVLGDPVCSSLNKPALIRDFLSLSHRTCFVQSSQDTASFLSSKGFLILPFGMENRINLYSLNLSWSNTPRLKRYTNKYHRLGFKLQETSFLDKDITIKIQSLIDDWIESRVSSSRTQSLLTKPISFIHDPITRLFVLKKGANIAAFALLDPIFDQFKLLGYAASRFCFLPAYSNASYALLTMICSKLKQEGFSSFDLGVSPFYSPINGISNSKFWSYLTRLLYRYGNDIYSFKGLQCMKSAFNPQQSLSYLCFSSQFPVLDFLSIYDVLKG